MTLFGKLRQKHQSDRLRDDAMDLERDENYAAAAENYAKRASIDLASTDNELIFADDCISAFKDYLKAGDATNALGQARRALQGYEMGDWLSDDNDDENLHDLTDMVADMRQAGHPGEADAFLGDVNTALAKIGRAPLMISVVAGGYSFPDQCPHCGAAIQVSGVDLEMKCPFCDGEVEAIS
jgi:hypothetical protein